MKKMLLLIGLLFLSCLGLDQVDASCAIPQCKRRNYDVIESTTVGVTISTNVIVWTKSRKDCSTCDPLALAIEDLIGPNDTERVFVEQGRFPGGTFDWHSHNSWDFKSIDNAVSFVLQTSIDGGGVGLAGQGRASVARCQACGMKTRIPSGGFSFCKLPGNQGGAGVNRQCLEACEDKEICQAATCCEVCKVVPGCG